MVFVFFKSVIPFALFYKYSKEHFILDIISHFYILLEVFYTSPFEMACLALKERFALLNYNLKKLFLSDKELSKTSVLMISADSKRILKNVISLYDKLTDCVDHLNNGLSFSVKLFFTLELTSIKKLSFSDNFLCELHSDSQCYNILLNSS